jgi:hypothetical protein
MRTHKTMARTTKINPIGRRKLLRGWFRREKIRRLGMDIGLLLILHRNEARECLKPEDANTKEFPVHQATTCNLFVSSKAVQLLVIDPGFLYNKFAATYTIADFLKGGATDWNFILMSVQCNPRTTNQFSFIF